MGKGTSATYNPANSCPVLARMTGKDGYNPPTQEFVLGKDDYGCDLKLYGATANKFMHWDESADTLILGQDGYGCDLKLYGDTAGSYVLWDESEDSLVYVNSTFTIGTAQGSGGRVLLGGGGITNSGVQIHTRMGTAVAAGAYAGAYITNTVTITQTNNVSIFGTWSELYITGGTITLISNHAAVWGNLEISGTVTLPGGIGWHAGLVGTVISPSTLTVSSGGLLAGVIADSQMTASYTATGAYVAGFAVRAGTSKPWAMGLYIPAGAVDKAIVIGALSSDTAGSGVALTNSVTRVMEVHADDNDTARTAGIQGRAIFGRNMVYAATTQENWGIDGLLKWSGVVHTMNVNAGVVGRFEAIGTCSTAVGSGNTYCAGVMGRVGSGGTGFTIGSGTQIAGVLAFYNTSVTNAFTNTGTCGFLAVASELAGTGNWDYGLYFEDVVRAGYIISELSGSSALNSLELTVGEATTPASGYAHGIHVTYNKSGVDTGSNVATMQFNAIGIDYTISGTAGNIAGYNAFYTYVMKSGSPDLADCAIFGANLEMTELGATNYYGGLWITKYNTTLATAIDTFILLSAGASGVTRTGIYFQGINLPTYFLEFATNANGFLDEGSGAGATCNGHIEVKTLGGSKYLRLYDGTN